MDVLRVAAVDFISLDPLDIVAVGGGGVEPFVVVVGATEVFIGDWERERSDEPAVEAITGGMSLLTVDDSVVG
jgi:hypothetical protein